MAVLIPGKLLFVAQQHTASMAITEVMLRHGGLFIQPGHTTLRRIRSGHAWVEYKGQTARGPRASKVLTGTETSFTVVRNPYDAITTWYVRSKFKGSFEQFVTDVGRRISSAYVLDNDIRWHSDVEIRLRYENLTEDFTELMHLEGFGKIELPVKNVTANKNPWHSYYTQAALDTVNERFVLDIAAMGYRRCETTDELTSPATKSKAATPPRTQHSKTKQRRAKKVLRTRVVPLGSR